MRDVGRRAGVSVMTVSRVVNDSAYVELGTRQRVEAAIAELGYLQNAAASSLRRTGATSLSIGLVVDDVANPFCSAVAAGVERVCRQWGHLLLTGSSAGEPAQERALISAFLTRRIDGLLIMGSDPDHTYLATEVDRGMPAVFVDRSPAGLDADVVASDNVVGAHLATTHLLEHGHRRIAFLSDRISHETARRRRQGYRDALTEAGVALSPHLERVDLTDAISAQRAVEQMLDGAQPPTAVFAAQNLVTLGVLAALHQRSVQHQVALVGLDDLPLGGLLDPAVSVIIQDADQIGAQAAELLFARLTGWQAPARQLAVGVHLVRRGSGEIRLDHR